MKAKQENRVGELGRRERQIVEAVYRLGRASVGEVRKVLPDPPSYSSVRAMLNLLERKGHLKHARDGIRYVYKPVVPAERVRFSALRSVISTFFGGSPLAAATALLELPEMQLTEAAKERLKALIEQAEREGK